MLIFRFQRDFCFALGSCRSDFAISAPRQLPGTVESRCGAVALGSVLSVAAPFVWRCPSNLTITPFPHPAHRTGRADFPHPALGRNTRPSHTARCTVACIQGAAQPATTPLRRVVTSMHRILPMPPSLSRVTPSIGRRTFSELIACAISCPCQFPAPVSN